ncbi:MAG: phosphatase PAP2 family protein [Bacteroidetes bacterium]|nr:phosphatase PAP2 family protein [Bacteroidota bacterium]
MKYNKIFFLFVFINTLNAQEPENSIDVKLFREINNNQSSFKTNLLNITDKTLISVSAIAPISVIGYGLIKNNNDIANYGVEMASAQILSQVIKTILKEVSKRNRPFRDLQNVNLRENETEESFSFPSGHTTSAFALATTVALNSDKKELIIPMYLWATAVGYGRIYFGVHYPSDVLGGAILGCTVGYAIHKYFDNNEIKIFKNEKFKSIFGVTKINIIPFIDKNYSEVKVQISF